MSPHKISRRVFLQFGLLSGTGVVLAACAPAPAPGSAPAAQTAPPNPTVAPPPQDAVVTLQQIDEGGMTSHSNAINQIIQDFQAENPGIKVQRTIAPSDPQNTWTVTNAALASGTPPDIFFGSGRAYMKDMARKGIILDLTDEVKSWGYKWVPGTDTQMTFKDKIYSAPWDIQFKFLTYNKELFTKNSLTIPTTWNDWISTCDALKKAGVTPCSFGAQGGDQWAALNWVWLFNQKLMGIKEVVNNMEVEVGTYDNPLYEKALDLLVELNDKGYFGTNPVSVPHSAAQAKLFGGAAGSLYSGTWDLSTMLDATKCPPDFLNKVALETKIWHDSSWPGEAYGVQGGAMGWDIPVKAPHKAEALKWLKYLCGGKAAQTFHSGTQYFMANSDYKPVFSNPEIVKLAESLKTIDGMFDFGDQSGDPNIWPVYCVSIQAVLNHESTSKEGMDKVRAAAKEARDKANA
jgi:raffinose/stachyose/melibiose transport system substrate-binding protein